MFDGRWRTGVEQGVRPVASSLRRTGVTANQLTATGLVIAAGCAVAVGAGHLGLGLALLALSALPDLLDGAVAKAAGTASPRGAFFDSVADRVTDSLVLGGIAWYVAGAHGSRAALLPFAVLAASTLVSYERAKAESLGYSAKGGLMERAERVIALGFGLAFSALLLPVLWLMLGLTLVTAGQRFAKVWIQAGAPAPAGDLAREASRWRSWRESAAQWRESTTLRPRRLSDPQHRLRTRRERGTTRAWRRRTRTRP